MATVEVITIKEEQELKRIMLDNPDMQKQLKKIIRQVLRKARSGVSNDAKNAISNDPRQSFRAVKHAVYKRILGGSVNILQKRKAGSMRVKVEKERTLQFGQRGGNRRARSQRTEEVDSYYGADRGFILRFLNAGTDNRTTRYGNRGSIDARNWFGSSAHKHMEKAAEEFCRYMDEVISKETHKS